MHKTGSITTLLLLSLTPVVVGAQVAGSGAQPAAVSAQTEPAAVRPSPTAVSSLDTLSLIALHRRLLDLERRPLDPWAERIKWIAFALVGISVSGAWYLGRRIDRMERSETTQREATKELWKDLLRPAEAEKSLQEFVSRFEKAAGHITDVGGRAEVALRLMNDRLSDTSERFVHMQREFDRRPRAESGRNQSGSST